MWIWSFHACSQLPPALHLGAQQGGGEDDGVEWDVVLAHELNQLHILRCYAVQCNGVQSVA